VRTPRLQWLFVQRIASAYAQALRDNLENSIGSDGESDFDLAPLGIWDKANFRTRGISGGWTKADRSNSDTPLVDTGRLRNSIRIGSVRLLSDSTTSTGRRGRSYQIVFTAAPHGVEQARGGRFDEILLGRTRSIRAARNFGDLREGWDFVVRKDVTVPSRPWNNISRTRLRNIANEVMRGITGESNAGSN
jgi:hypothetical protein